MPGSSDAVAPLPVRGRNPTTDLRKMRRIISEDPGWSLALVAPLSELCLQHIVKNFERNPVVDELLPKHRAKVLSGLSPGLPLRVTAGLIGHDDYWRRCCGERWGPCDVSRHGGSWKRLFFERHLQNLIECFIPDLTGPGAILEVAECGRDHVKKLDIQQLLPPVRLEVKKEEETDEASDSGSDAGSELPSMDHFSLRLIAASLAGLEELHLVYGVKGCGMNFEWKLFCFTERDCSDLAGALTLLKNLKVFRLHRSRVQDEAVRVLVASLLDLPSLSRLDLSHNLISDRGARAVGKLVARGHLRALNLCNNNVRHRGAQALAHALSHSNALTALNLRLNRIGDEGAQSLCRALLHNTSLTTLHLGSNELSEPTAAALSQLLSQNTSLQSVSLSCNRIGPDGGKQLLDGVSQNRVLLELDVRLAAAGQESDFLIQQTLRGNRERAGREADRGAPRTGREADRGAPRGPQYSAKSLISQ
ncbi:dynein regulatory complex subunit 5 [Spea bombifrons]|uniref:dynein regulatory complex subunit 5 n=1 Tax=Spea bombifrons TaxID=233779 RepID=UPI002349340D|nr:dynein regulatory complex subunit 5 [Spea bombifrons]